MTHIKATIRMPNQYWTNMDLKQHSLKYVIGWKQDIMNQIYREHGNK